MKTYQTIWMIFSQELQLSKIKLLMIKITELLSKLKILMKLVYLKNIKSVSRMTGNNDVKKKDCL